MVDWWLQVCSEIVLFQVVQYSPIQNGLKACAYYLTTYLTFMIIQRFGFEFWYVIGYHLDLCNVFGDGVYPEVDVTYLYYGAPVLLV